MINKPQPRVVGFLRSLSRPFGDVIYSISWSHLSMNQFSNCEIKRKPTTEKVWIFRWAWWSVGVATVDRHTKRNPMGKWEKRWVRSTHPWGAMIILAKTSISQAGGRRNSRCYWKEKALVERRRWCWLFFEFMVYRWFSWASSTLMAGKVVEQLGADCRWRLAKACSEEREREEG